MRLFRSAVLLLAVGVLSACSLPDRRPDAELVIRRCDGVQAPGVISHGECLQLDGSGSTTAAGGATYHWEARTLGTSGELSTRTLTGEPLAAPGCATSGPLICGTFFQDDVGSNGATILLTVSDQDGHDRTVTQQLVLTNERPELLEQDRHVRPRSIDLIIHPWLLVYPSATDADEDELEFSVRQIRKGDFPIEGGTRCAAITPNPAPDGDSKAWCFPIALRDDPLTPFPESIPLLSQEPVDYTFRVRVRERHARDPLADRAEQEDCSPRLDLVSGEPLEQVSCVQIRLEDTVWVGGGGPDTGRVGRVSPNWRRRTVNNVSLRDGLGMTNLRDKVIFAGTGVCETPVHCEGAVVVISPTMSFLTIRGFGAIQSLDTVPGTDASPGVWGIVYATNSAGNPGVTQVPRTATVSGQTFDSPYLLFVPASIFPAIDQSEQNLLAVPPAVRAQLRVGFNLAATGDPLRGSFIEVPRDIQPRPDGKVWLYSELACENYDPIAEDCATTGSPARVGRLRLLPEGAGDIDVGAIPHIPIEISTTPSIIPATNWLAHADLTGGIWIVDAIDPAEHRIRHLNASGVVVSEFQYIGSPTSLAYDPGTGAGNDVLWIGDALSGGILRIPAPGQLVGEQESFTSYGPFTKIAAIAIDGVGGVWIDDHTDPSTRLTAYLPPLPAGADPSSLSPVYLNEFISYGTGIVPSQSASTIQADLARGAWHPDLFDVVRIPLQSAVEIPAMATGPVFSSVAGVDGLDGSAYVFAPSTGDNLFRAGPDGGFTPLAALDALPTCGAIVPDFPRVVTATSLSGFIPSTMWLCLIVDEDETRFVQIELRHLREIGAGRVPKIEGDLPLCSTLLAGDDRPCWKSDIRSGLVVSQMAGGSVGLQMVLSVFDFHLYVAHGGPPPGCANLGLLTIRLFDIEAPDLGIPPAVDHGTIFPPFSPELLRCPAQMLAPFVVPRPGPEPRDYIGGVWATRASGDFIRWSVETGTLAPDPTARIDAPTLPPLAGFPARDTRAASLSMDLVPRGLDKDDLTVGVWTAFDDPVYPTAMLRRSLSYTTSSGFSFTVPAGPLDVPGRAQAMASSPFADSAWTTGDDGHLVRVHAGGDLGSDLQLEYVRLPNFLGSSTATPAGRSITLGGF